jgi:hypothetical protein
MGVKFSSASGSDLSVKGMASHKYEEMTMPDVIEDFIHLQVLEECGDIPMAMLQNKVDLIDMWAF